MEVASTADQFGWCVELTREMIAWRLDSLMLSASDCRMEYGLGSADGMVTWPSLSPGRYTWG